MNMRKIKSKKGDAAICTFILFIVFCVIILILASQSENHMKNICKETDSLAYTYINQVEKDGYITPEVKADINKKLTEAGADIVKVDGTFNKVKSGEKVTLSIEEKSTNAFGGIVDSYVSTKTGNAK